MRDEIVEHAARAFWVSAWGDTEEEKGNTYPGQDLFDCAPETPGGVLAATASWYATCRGGDQRHLSGDLMYADFRGGCTLETPHETREMSPELFGHYLAMEAMGHGVGLWEWRDHTLEIPTADAPVLAAYNCTGD